MPGFSTEKGGPLTEAQIDSIAKVLTQAISTPAMTIPGAISKTNVMAPASLKSGVAMKQ
jgi:hypothetical protein